MLKAIIITVFLTVSAIGMMISLLFKSFLGTFGFAVTSLDTLNNLRQSQYIVEKMKSRHESKKVRATKRFINKSGKKVAATALAASTIGTAAAVITVASFEVDDYCQEKRELQDDENILLGTDSPFDFNRCVEEAHNDSKKIVQDTMKDFSETVSTKVSQVSKETWKKIRLITQNTFESSEVVANDLWESLQSLLEKPK